MANVNNPHSFIYERQMGGTGAVPLVKMLTVSNQTLCAGDPVVLSSGYVKLAGATSTAIFGIAAEPVTGTAATRKYVLVIPALPNFLFSGQCSGNFTVGYIGRKVGISGTTNGRLQLNLAATTSVAQIVGLKTGSSYGTYGEAMFVWCKSQYTGQS